MVSIQFQLNVFMKYSSIHIAENIYIIFYSLESTTDASCLNTVDRTACMHMQALYYYPCMMC